MLLPIITSSACMLELSADIFSRALFVSHLLSEVAYNIKLRRNASDPEAIKTPIFF